MNSIKKHWKSAILGASSIAFGFLAVFLGGKLYLTRNTSISPGAPQSMPAASFTNSCQGFSLTFATPISTTTPVSSPTDTPLATATATATGTPTTLASASPTTSPTTAPTATPQVACNLPCSTDATCKSIDSSYTCYPPTSTCRLADFPDRQECNVPPSSTPTPHNSFECNSVCSSNAECLTLGSNYTCYNTGTDKRCRITTNLTSSSCTKTITSNSTPNTTVPSPVSNQLPHAGIGLPTTIILSLGAILIVGSLLLI